MKNNLRDRSNKLFIGASKVKRGGGISLASRTRIKRAIECLDIEFRKLPEGIEREEAWYSLKRLRGLFDG